MQKMRKIFKAQGDRYMKAKIKKVEDGYLIYIYDTEWNLVDIFAVEEIIEEKS